MGTSHKQAQESQNAFQSFFAFWPFPLAVIAYVPALNNGFIADDYVILQRLDLMRIQPLLLFQVSPENFRLTSYMVFGFLKALTGYDARLFYAVNIAIHLVNIALMYRLLSEVLEDEFVSRTATMLFAVFQAPQEAIMWLAAMNETTLAFFTLLTLLMWLRKRYVTASLAYGLALFSKESGIIVLLLIALLDLKQRQRQPYWAYACLLIPTAIFASVFLGTIASNFMITNRSYAFGPRAVLVLILSLHRLVWPWLYIILFLLWIKDRNAVPWKKLPVYLACVAVPMVPYMFIAYQDSLPSRQLYLCSAVLMTIFALLLRPLERSALPQLFVIVFAAFNIGYLWMRKDTQFEDRAAPTTQLIAVLAQHPPQPTLLLDFAYPYPAIAHAAALAVPGWKPELIFVNQAADKCGNCLTLRWNAREKRYE